MTTGSRVAAVSLLGWMTLGIAAPAVAGTDWSHAKEVTVITADEKFQPNTVVFQHGETYRLHLENHATEMHEFHSAEFFKAATLRDPGVLDADKDEVVLQPGEKKDVYLVAPAAATYPLVCPDHDWEGMTGQIIVK